MEAVSERTPLLLASYVKGPDVSNTQNISEHSVATTDERFKGHGYTMTGGPVSCGELFFKPLCLSFLLIHLFRRCWPCFGA